ncbi:MAG: Acylneuraminate cytidylyltransferase [Rhodospirillales bacterium]|nr:Acylneuraminate cytidylyltransferase [Rhodospirillales bacterium]
MSDIGPIIGLIPARGGSKSIPRKNLAMLAGKPLLTHTATAALAAERLDRTLLSTDDEEIAAAGRTLGIEVPFLRPSELSGDAADMLPVMRHALDFLDSRGTAAAALVLLQPTSPLRTAEHIDAAVELFLAQGAETLVSVVAVPHQFNPVSVMTMDGATLRPFLPGPAILRRQDKPHVVARNGPAILIVGQAALRRGTLYGDPTVGYVMSAADSLDIDEPDDLWLAEQYLTRRSTDA